MGGPVHKGGDGRGCHYPLSIEVEETCDSGARGR